MNNRYFNDYLGAAYESSRALKNEFLKLNENCEFKVGDVFEIHFVYTMHMHYSDTLMQFVFLTTPKLLPGDPVGPFSFFAYCAQTCKICKLQISRSKVIYPNEVSRFSFAVWSP